MIAALFHPKYFVSFPRIPFLGTIEIQNKTLFSQRRTYRYDFKCRKALWLQAREELWSTVVANGRSQTCRDFSRERIMNCCFACCSVIFYVHFCFHIFVLLQQSTWEPKKVIMNLVATTETSISVDSSRLNPRKRLMASHTTEIAPCQPWRRCRTGTDRKCSPTSGTVL